MAEDNSKEVISRKKSKRKPILIGLIVIGAIILLLPVLEKYNYRKSTEADFPSSEDLHTTEENMGQLQSDYDAAQETLKDDPYNLDANIKKAQVLSFLEEYDKALTIYVKMSEMHPGDSRPFKGAGDIYFTQRKYAEAKEAYQKAINIDPKNAEAYIQMARLYAYLDAGNEEKDKFYRESIEKVGEGSQATMINYYAKYLESVGDYDKAIEQLKVLLQKTPDDNKIRGEIERLDDLRSEKTENQQSAPAAPAAGA